MGSASTLRSSLTASPAPIAICARLVLTSRGPTATAACDRRSRPRLSLLSKLAAAATNRRWPRNRMYDAWIVPRSSLDAVFAVLRDRARRGEPTFERRLGGTGCSC